MRDREHVPGGRIAACVLLLAAAPCCGGAVDPAVERALARIGERPAEEFEQRIDDDPATGLAILREIAAAVPEAPGHARATLATYLGAAARSRARRLSGQGPPFDDEALAGWLALVFLDRTRLAGEPDFRRFVLEVARRAHDDGVSVALRSVLLRRIERLDGIDFAQLESIAVAWGAARRASAKRAVAYAAGNGRSPDDDAPIDASLYSLPSHLIDTSAALGFLTAVRAAAPGRPLLVLADGPALVGALAGRDDLQPLHVIRNDGAPYTPWPRDPFSLLRRDDGGVLLLVRPNLQRLREQDNTMGLRLIQQLPEPLDEAWGRPTWERSPVAFHNGQLLPAREAIWLSAHSLEPRILQLLAEPAIRVAQLATPDGWERYADAARRAAAETGRLFGKPPWFVHPLAGNDGAFLAALGGGAGFDLDSLLTPLVGPDGRTHALVGDIAGGVEVLVASAAAQLDAFGRTFGLAAAGEELRGRLLAAQRDDAAAALGRFVDLVASHLQRSGIPVERLPLLWVPAELAPREKARLVQPFLVTWNNSVQERRDGRRRAEGFSGGLAAGDERARQRFQALGYRLDLFPPLVESVVRNGGYRCASQHLRR